MENYIIGFGYVIPSITFIFLHICCLYVFFTCKSYWKLMCYKILFCMGISDMLQLYQNLYIGLLCIFKQTPSYWGGNIVTGIGNAGWSAIIPQILMLALNRWNVLVRNIPNERYEKTHSFISFLVISYSYAAAWLLWFLSPYCSLAYTTKTNRYSAQPNESWGLFDQGFSCSDVWGFTVINIELSQTIPMLTFMLLLYIWIAISLLYQKTSLLKATRNAWREYKILIQGVAVFLYAVVETILWHYSDILLPNFLIGEYTSPAINIGWIFFCGMTPIMNLVMNSDLRERIRRIFTKHRDKAGTKVKVFYASKRYWKIMCYKILLCMSITDIIQLFGHVYTGYLAISKEATWYFVEVIIGGLANAGHSVMLSQTMMLAFNRWSVLVRKEQRSEDDTKRAFIIFVIITYAYGGLFVITYFTPYCNLTYYADGYYWAYTNDSYSQIVAKVELYTAIAIMTTTLLLYVWIVVSLIMQKTNLSQSSKNAWQEYKILIQGIFLFVYAMIEIIGWHYGDIILPAALIGQYTNPVFNIVWIGFCGLTPIMNLVTNRDLRKTVLSHLTGKFDVTTVTKMQESSHTRTYNNKL